MEPSVPNDLALLRRLATVKIDVDARLSVLNLVNAIDNWIDLITKAEKHGLSNLVYQHLTDLGVDIPTPARHQFIALKARHRKANLIRHNAVEEILEVFSKSHIESILLKGAALVKVLYDSPELRPMSDIDILVKPEQADLAQQCLKRIGYTAQARKTGYLVDHHHLPIATRTMDGIRVHVEIHHDALSGDVDASISFNNMNGNPRSFSVGKQTGYALDHTDMLRHLCHHTFEPVEELKLGAVADLYGYADKYIDEIDQQHLATQYPFVANIFSILHYVSPLPKKLQGWITVPQAPPPQGVGLGFPPMTHTLALHKGLLDRARYLLNPPQWWLHGFYNISPGNSITFTRLFKHPKTVVKWLFRRFRAKLHSRSATIR